MNRIPSLLAFLIAILAMAVPLWADPPEIMISPDGGTYSTGTPTGSVSVAVSVAIYDPEGLNRSSLQVTLQSGATTRAVSMSWSSPDGMRATLKGNVTLSPAGDHVLTVQIADLYGNAGLYSATYRLVYTPPPAPPALITDTSAFHNDFRDTSLDGSSLSYALAGATVYGAPGGVSLIYHSEQGNPTAYYQIDARPDASIEAATTALSLRIEERDAPHHSVTREFFWARAGSGNQRLAAQWDMGARPTGAYHYVAVIRAYKSDGGTHEVRVPFRVLVANERSSRYGHGWSVAGVQRIHGGAEGLLLNEGNGVLRWYAKPGCAAGADCVYTTPAGDFSTIRYTAATGRWTRSFRNGVVIEYSGGGLMTSVTDRFGRRTSFEWQKTQDGQNADILSRIVDPAGQQIVFSYYSGAWLQSITAAGQSVTLWYNGVKVTDLIGPSRLRNITYTADELLAAYTEEYPDWYRRTFGYSYDAYRRVRTATSPAVTVNGASVTPQVTVRSLASVTVPDAATGTSLANLAPALASTAAMVEVKDPGGHATRIASDRYGNPIRIVDAIGAAVTIDRNSSGLPLLIQSPTSTTAHEWDTDGHLTKTLVNGVVTYAASYLDGLLHNEQSGQQDTWYSYGARGELLRSWYGDYSDSIRNGTTYEYNGRYQLIRMTSPNGGKVEWSYDGNAFFNPDYERISRTDGSLVEIRTTYKPVTGLVDTVGNAYGGERQVYAYDQLRRVVSVTDAQNLSVTYAYTGPHLSKVTDRAGKTYELVYNALGWLETEKFPDTKFRSYQYDIDGLMVSRTDRRLKTVTSSYDALHRPYNVTADGATTTFRYPTVHTTEATNAEATVTSRVAAATGFLENYSIARAGRRYDIRPGYDTTDAYRSSGFDIVFSMYDSVVRTDTIRYTPDYAPTVANTSYRLSIRDVSGFTSSTGLDASGRPAWTFFANGITQNNAFTADGRLNSISYSPSTLAGSLGASYSYDNLNRLSSRTSATNDYSYVYYDTIGRLTTYGSWTNSIVNRTESYSYDAAGNRTDRGAVLQPNSNRYTAFNGFTMEYDAEGNITRKYSTGVNAVDQRFTWNSLGQLTSVTTNGLTTSYGYDPLGNRFRRTEGTDTRFYVYFNGDLLVETDGNGAPMRTYTHWPGIDHPLSVRVTNGTQNSVYYYALEQPGHVTGLMDAAGSVVARYRYTPWGDVESSSGTVDQPLRYMAREYDSTTRLYYVRNRWYDTALARFLSEDPIGLEGGLNAYAYVSNDPMNGRDPSGLVHIDVDAIKKKLSEVKIRVTGMLPTIYVGGPPPKHRQLIDLDNLPNVTDYLVVADPVSMGSGPAKPKPEEEPEGEEPNVPTIGPRYESAEWIARAARREQCRFYATWARRWTVFEAFEGGGGAVQARNDPGYQARVTITTSPGGKHGPFTGHPEVGLNPGQTPHFDRGWRSSMGTSYAADMRDMAATVCAGL